MEENKISIIEGPPPIFETAQDGWALGLGEGPHLGFSAITHLRTYNGPALVERCYHAWQNKSPIHLHFRNGLGLEEHAPIIAARSVETAEGQVLLLWVNLDREKVQFELDPGNDEDAEDEN